MYPTHYHVYKGWYITHHLSLSFFFLTLPREVRPRWWVRNSFSMATLGWVHPSNVGTPQSLAGHGWLYTKKKMGWMDTMSIYMCQCITADWIDGKGGGFSSIFSSLLLDLFPSRRLRACAFSFVPRCFNPTRRVFSVLVRSDSSNIDFGITTCMGGLFASRSIIWVFSLPSSKRKGDEPEWSLGGGVEDRFGVLRSRIRYAPIGEDTQPEGWRIFGLTSYHNRNM